MKTLRQFCILLILCTQAARVFGWGDEGHETIGAMADTLIAGTPASARVHELLGDETLSAASVWADRVKGRDGLTPEMAQFKTDNPNHFIFHYTDIPFEELKYRDDSIGATNVDVVHAIPACILILQGKPEAQTMFTNVSPRVALRLLAHYIEDLHQPLHVGAGYLDKTTFVNPNGYSGRAEDDQGGNRLLFGGTNKLHFFWDITVVQLNMTKAHVDSPEKYAAALLAQPAPDWKLSSPLLDVDRDWANESLAHAGKIHDVTVLDEDNSELDRRTHRPRTVWHIKDLSPEYISWSCKTAESQMTKAGYRLAATLEAIWP
ncbi:MAG TPA: S1/P1 nuclease [Verrucomicrobiae bacterium]|jgi:hypothetical protein